MIRIKTPKNGDEVTITWFRKFANLEEIAPIIENREYKTTYTKTYYEDSAYKITPKEMTNLLKNLMKNRDWIDYLRKEQFVTDGKRVLLINSEGYSNARYVGIIVKIKKGA